MSKVFWLSVAVFLSACVQPKALAPGPSAKKTSPTSAETHVAGVQVSVDGDAWKGSPPTSGELVPVLVTLNNESEHPIQIRYDSFSLNLSGGFHLLPLPPYRVAQQSAIEDAPASPDFYYSDFFISPWYAPYYPGFSVWPDSVGHGFDYNGAYGGWPVEPDENVLARAIPEGVLDSGGKLSGYLYFASPQGGERTDVEFTARLIDARSGEELGEGRIPFVVVRRGESATPPPKEDGK